MVKPIPKFIPAPSQGRGKSEEQLRASTQITLVNFKQAARRASGRVKQLIRSKVNGN